MAFLYGHQPENVYARGKMAMFVRASLGLASPVSLPFQSVINLLTIPLFLGLFILVRVLSPCSHAAPCDSNGESSFRGLEALKIRAILTLPVMDSFVFMVPKAGFDLRVIQQFEC